MESLHPALLCMVIFAARVVDVSLGTVRTILIFRGHRALAAATGFLEILTWLLAASQVLKSLDGWSRWYLAIAYAGGFAAGNYVGIWVEGKIAIGSELVRVISSRREMMLGQRLRQEGYQVTDIDATTGDARPVEVLLIVERRRRIPKLLKLISQTDPESVWTITDVKRQTSYPPPLARRFRKSM